MGLKAANAFWNPEYYDPNRRTVTKKLLYSDQKDFVNELRSLVYLALITDRTLIIPNTLGGDFLEGVDSYKDSAMWPGFRIIRINPKQSKFKGVSQVQSKRDLSTLSIVEPAFYWRVKRDYSASIPEPSVISFNKDASLQYIEERLLSEDIAMLPRLIINIEGDYQNKDSKIYKTENKDINEESNFFHRIKANGIHDIEISPLKMNSLVNWAADSVGSYQHYLEEKENYVRLPKIIREPRYINKQICIFLHIHTFI
jgi:hypothetical protein